jgi:hypothetical protein
MSRSASIHLETFVLRLWWEKTSLTWRGEIIHLPGNESEHFATLAQAEGFIEQFIPQARDASGGRHRCEK